MRTNKQQGMAMLMALVMLAIASTLAVSIWYSNQLSIARMQNNQQSYQASHYAQGLMLWASDILRQDYAQADSVLHDSNRDGWLQGIEGMVVEDAVLSGYLVGLSGRFNVNNLYFNGAKQEEHIAMFRRLLVALNLNVNLADQVVDWIDPDQVPEPNGAEDFIYLARSPGYQTAGRGFKHVDELRLLDGMTDVDFATLAPHVTALPVSNQATKMNVNTLSPVLLKALHPLITEEKALQLYQEGQADFMRLDDFFNHPAIRFELQQAQRTQLQAMVGVQTLFLQAQSLVQMGDSQYVQYALLARSSDGSAQVIYRSMRPFLPTKQVQ